jgi:acyl-CoA thioesterase
MHPLDSLLALHPIDSRTDAVTLTDAYWNFNGQYGGVSCALVMATLLRDPTRLGDPLSMTVNFATPVATGPARLHKTLLAQTRSTQQWQVRITQDVDGSEVLRSVAMVVFAVRRPSYSDVEIAPPQAPAYEAVPRTPRAGLNWLQRYEFRFVEGVQTTARADSKTVAYVRDDPPRSLDYCSLAAIADSFFPRLFLRLGGMHPIATITLSIYFHATASALVQHGDAPVLTMARARSFESGYGDHIGELWGAQGQLLATTEQLMWFKAEARGT